MNAAIITIGDEILIGQVVDTNSAWLGQQLTDIGISVKKTWSVSDSHEEIILAIRQAVDEADIVFMTGGLGPTKDDITKKALADIAGVGLYFHDETFERIKTMFARLGRPMSPHHNDQCLMPQGAEILRNSMGTAPGMLVKVCNKRIISMPGVPYEMKAIMQEVVLPMLSNDSGLQIVHHTILTCGAGETTIENEISDIVSTMPDNIGIAYLPAIGQVRLRLTAKGKKDQNLIQQVEKVVTKIQLKIPDIIYGYGDSTLPYELQKICISKGITLSTAESCTGGNIAAKIVAVPGSSACFTGSIVAYSNQIKIKTLSVKPKTLETFGAVSEETVKEMVDGVLLLFGTEVAVAVSGIAGPDGGSHEKPVGTIWICVGNKTNKSTFLLKSGKDRSNNIEAASVYAMIQLRKFILEQY